jgi:hypothetical protein
VTIVINHPVKESQDGNGGDDLRDDSQDALIPPERYISMEQLGGKVLSAFLTLHTA